MPTMARRRTSRAIFRGAALALVVSLTACDATAILGPQPISDQLEMEVQVPPPGAEAGPAIANARAMAQAVDREFGVDLSRQPDVVGYGTARCVDEPSCLGPDAGRGPWTVWHVRWQPDERAAWIAVLIDATTSEQLWLGADRGR